MGTFNKCLLVEYCSSWLGESLGSIFSLFPLVARGWVGIFGNGWKVPISLLVSLTTEMKKRRIFKRKLLGISVKLVPAVVG